MAPPTVLAPADSKKKIPLFSLPLKNLQPWNLKWSRVVVSIDGSWLKIAHGESVARGRAVTRLEAIPIQDQSSESVAATLKDALLAMGLQGAHGVVLHPAQFTRAHFLRLPSTDPAELDVIVDFQIEKNTPDAKEETLSYYRVLASDKEGYTSIMLVMTHQDAVSRAVSVAHDCRLKVDGVHSALDGFVNWYRLLKRRLNPAPAATVLAVDIDAASSTLLLFDKNEPYLHRSIPLGFHNLCGPEAQESYPKFIQEIQRSLLSFEGEGLNIRCQEILITGLAEKLPGFGTKMEKELNLPVRTLPSIHESFLIPASPPDDTVLSRVSFTPLIGLALSPGTGDLTPKPVKLRLAFEARVRRLITLGFQILGCLFLISAILFTQLQQDLAYRDWLNAQYEAKEPEARQLAVYLDQLSLVRQLLEQRGTLLDTALEVQKSTPDAVQWDTLTFTQGEELALKGFSRDMPKVFEMVTALENSPLLEKPTVGRVAKRKVNERDVTAFEMVAPFKKREPPA